MGQGIWAEKWLAEKSEKDRNFGRKMIGRKMKTGGKRGKSIFGQKNNFQLRGREILAEKWVAEK